MDIHKIDFDERVIDWLLEEKDPPIRYFTLCDLLGRSPADPDVLEARRQVHLQGPVPRILASQNEDGYWGLPQDFYIRSKYKGTVWSLILLAQLGVDGKDKRINRAVEFVLRVSQDWQSGGFAYAGAETGGKHEKIIPCLTGNMVWSLIRFGWLNDPRVQRGIEWITSYQRFDDGNNRPPEAWPYLLESCWGSHTCHYGVVKSLKALAEIPKELRSLPVRETIHRAVEYLLIHRIYQHSHAPGEIAMVRWMQFGFPYMWDTDMLEVLEILLSLECRDVRMDDAIKWVRQHQNEDGTWHLDRSYNGRTLARIEKEGQPSKWVTLKALKVLSAYDR
jgi:hypothetical protein